MNHCRVEKPDRIAQIEADYEVRRKRDLAKRKINPLRVLAQCDEEDIDELYGLDEGAGACLICHK